MYTHVITGVYEKKEDMKRLTLFDAVSLFLEPKHDTSVYTYSK